MRAATTIILTILTLIAPLTTAMAAALDLAEAQRQGAVLREALALGADGDWPAAEARVAAVSDPLLADIVLWRKLRAGAGTQGEYRAYAARRANWPGHEQLRKAVLGEVPPARSAGLSGEAAENWRAFSKAYGKDRDAAAALLDRYSASAEALGQPARWADRRRRLARDAMRDGNPALGYRLAAQHHLGPGDGYAYADCEWAAGWIALRGLKDPAAALPHFERFDAAVDTPISRARAGYWLGRTHAALGNETAARAAYASAAEFQTAFYGQLAAAEIGAAPDQRLADAALPDWRTTPALATDDVRMAAVLYYAGQEGLAAASFRRIGRGLNDETALAALGALSIEIGQPQVAVRVAKMAARKGMLIFPAYYPLHAVGGVVTEIEPALALAVSRQETEFDATAISRSGARGLMQLMPRTAQLVARQIGEPYSQRRLITDWRYNARLGSRYMGDRVKQFGGSYLLAAAAYNAGPRRAEEWIAAYGDPRLASVDAVDWIETIPFRETRNYVQRVMEALYVYRTRIAGRAGPMTLPADLARGG
ncbi:lytic transglycosylase domain-containing protein [Paralimibaculum aggregatum]|uniref:Lytic transglycosylase domain-containing protein n=1 Tax=Paralimibaculum aggregatum TaxID=3036245 RepID=A0ABQ6LMA3_9RHOB|nr:lytic transglycosylase domain-containing protein [Limibaculum sp. NKW23]GMG84332.1 lytic transglycosylase domain-containing protein [Limibaculum sp. NKW23]